MSTCEYVIETRGLSKNYGAVHSLQALDLKVARHSILGFLGPNGAGKTTTIKLLLGLIRPSAGSAEVFGMDSVTESINIRARVGYLPQDPRFYEHLTARQTLHFAARFFFRGPAKAIGERVDEMLELAGLADKADRPIKTFSGGERQRLGIAQAEVNYPDLLILDEPAASLDPIGRRDILEVMSRLREYTTVFYSTHILDDVQRVSDAVVILNKGELVVQGSVEELLAGAGGVVYLVHLQQPCEETLRQLAAQPWVSSVIAAKSTAGHNKGAVAWQVSVSDAQAAEENLFRLLASGPAVVTEFRRKLYDLEDVFMRVVEAGQKQGWQGAQDGKQ
jgi:ABC-2 type transport system ATP-binding protein